MAAIRACAVLVLAACAATPEVPRAITVAPFGDAMSPSWTVVSPDANGAWATVADGALALTLPAQRDEPMIARHVLDVSGLRGQRVRLSVRARTEGPVATVARAGIVIDRTAAPSFRDFASSRTVHARDWAVLQTVIDVAPDAVRGQLELTLAGEGTAWFSGVTLEPLGATPTPTPVTLSSQQLANLVSFARASALIRYLHPSDEAATLDWDTFLSSAIPDLLRATTPAELAAALRTAFAPVAPTVSFTTGGEPGPVPARGAATQLVRWRRDGFGVDSPYSSFREGRDPDVSSIFATHRVSLPAGCKQLVVTGATQAAVTAGKVELVARLLQGGFAKQDSSKVVPAGDAEIAVAATVPADALGLELEVTATGGGDVTVRSLAVACDGAAPAPIDLGASAWQVQGDTALYRWTTPTCQGHACVRLARNQGGGFDQARDVWRRDLGNAITIHVPVAVWATSSRTLPAAPSRPLRATGTIDDLATRLAIITAAWGALSVFYPYFADEQIDWSAGLPAGFQEAARAASPEQTFAALAHLLARARDTHISIVHPAALRDGLLPLSFRRFDDRVIVIGGLASYLKTIPLGSEVLELRGEPALAVYARLAGQVSPATEVARDFIAALRFGQGTRGTFVRVRTRGPDGRTAEHVLPVLAADVYRHDVRGPKPANGAEVSPGIVYLDLETLTSAPLATLLPQVMQARAVVLDVRGYVTRATSELISHLIEHDIALPVFEIPVIPSWPEHPLQVWHTLLRPRAPKLAARVVVLIDGHAMSAAETQLQMIHDNHLAVLVGEPTAGTNGNVANVELPAGFTFRFTAMRVADDAGGTVQGHGFTPDHVVHPTLEGVKAGRDEVLEAGVDVARRLIAP